MGHEPVLREESVALLRRGGPGLYVDATLGAGGHAAALLTAVPEASLLGIDRDPEALALARARLAAFGDRVFFCTPTSARSPQRLLSMRRWARPACLRTWG
jgi:16S rRNA C1402 N4-methylase RsmH